MLPIYSQFDYERIRAERERGMEQARRRKLARESRRNRGTPSSGVRLSRLVDAVQMRVRLRLRRATVRESLDVPCADRPCLEIVRGAE